MSPKFYVYGGGRWRELDLNTGRVSGWAKSARIVVARNGRLEFPHTAPVLRALRALAAGEAGRAREGPRLLQKRWPEEEPQKQKQIPYSLCQHCCHHRYTAVVENVCNHAPAQPPAPPPHAQPLSHKSAVPSTHTLGTDNVFDRLRSECVNQPEPNSNSTQIRSPRKRAKRSISISKDPLHSATRRFNRQSISSNSSVEHVYNISNGIGCQQNRTPLKQENEEDNFTRRGRLPKSTPIKLFDIITSDGPVVKYNSKQQLRITSGKGSPPSPQNNRNVQRNTDTSRIQRSPESSRNTEQKNVPKITNEDSQTPSDNSDSEHTHDESRSNSDGEETQRTLEMNKLVAYNLHNGGVTAARARLDKPASRSVVCKEIVIDEKDVSALRGFLRRSAPNVSLTRFDNDDAYKRGIFFHLHPLVNLERSSRIQQMLSEIDDISLRDFASQLGLRSISDDLPSRHERPNGTITKASRKRKQPNRYTEVLPQATKSPANSFSASTKSMAHKTAKSSTSSKRTIHKNVGSISSPLKTAAHTSAKSQSRSSSPIETVARKNDFSKSSPTTKKKVASDLAMLFGSSNPIAHKNLTLKSSALAETTREVANAPNPAKQMADQNGMSPEKVFSLNMEQSSSKSRSFPEPVVSLSRDQTRYNSKPHQPGLERRVKEYSPSEDNAILSWVKKEERARRVNGNFIWRELQDQYKRLTGIGRTWQSLRNRYLRYILPSLSSLAVSPSSAARLRAAAATGEIKSKRRPARRNSIFDTQNVNDAWSRRPRLDPTPHTLIPPQPARVENSPNSPPPAAPPVALQAQVKGDTDPLSKKKDKRRKRSQSTSLSETSDSSIRYPQLRYSDVTRRFAKRQRIRFSSDSSESQALITLAAQSSTRSRKLFNPKAPL